MADQKPLVPGEWRELHPHLAVTVVIAPANDPDQPPPPPDTEKDHPRYGIFDFPFSLFFIVRVKSDSDLGRLVHNDLLGLLSERRIPPEIERDFEIPPEIREPMARAVEEGTPFFLLRANAEIPANPVRHTIAAAQVGNPGVIVGFSYKDPQ